MCTVCLQQLQAELKLSWSRAEAVGTVQHQLDSTFAQLHSQLEVDHHNVNCLVAAIALLCGTIYPLTVRASQLAAQRNLLVTQLQRFDTFKQQVI